MAVFKGKIGSQLPRHCNCASFRFHSCCCFSYDSSASSTVSDGDDKLIHDEQSAQLSAIDRRLAEKFHSLIKQHYRENPSTNPNSAPPDPQLIIPALDSHFSELSPSSISPAVVRHVIAQCGAPRHGIPFLQAFSFFNWAMDDPECATCADPYVKMIDLAGKLRHFDLAWHLFDRMRSRHIKIPAEAFLVLVRRYVRGGLAADAIRAFHRMGEYGCTPDLRSFSATIAVLCKKRRAQEAQCLFNSLKHTFSPDVVVYTSLINGWFRSGNIPEAEKVFVEMKRNGIQPNVYTYSVAIDALCRSGQINRAHDVFAEMIDNGCAPNETTFNNLMRVQVKAGQTEKVLQVYNQMKRLSCAPDVITYNFLIDVHCRDGNLDAAIKILNQMVGRDCSPNASSFNLLFSCISKLGDVNGAHRMYSKMKELHCQPNTVTYNILMSMFAGCNSVDMVVKLKREMDADGCEPNVNTYKILVTLFCGIGHWNRAYILFKEMIEEKCLKPSFSVYKLVLEQLRKAGQLRKHEELVEKMVDRGFATRPL